MITFFSALLVLLAGYFIYGKFIEKVFGADNERITPAYSQEDDVDYVPMDTKKVYLIQFLNIAGLGPIFGPIMGALYGPVAFFWIVIGAIFAGGVHDYMSGMMSVRTEGKSITEITGDYLGEPSRYLMLVVSVLLLLFVGVVFVVGPAALLAHLSFTNDGHGVFEGTIFGGTAVWITIIFSYYFISTIVPIDKIIGKIYPFFGAVLMFMAFGVAGAMIYHGLDIPELTDAPNFSNPKGIPVWPALFFTISCGAISGFHATQSPLMARTIKKESYGRVVFYGAMITEAVIAMIWASVGMAYFPDGINGLQDVIAKGGPGLVVNSVAVGYLGVVGGIIAILGVIVAPITSGDTAFRSIRLTLSDRFGIDQESIKNRLMIAVPIFIIAFMITEIGFASIWMYFSFSNQFLATITLWTAVAFLYRHGKNFWVAALPGLFMSGSIVGYILTAKEFPLHLSHQTALIAGSLTALAILFYLVKLSMNRKQKGC